MKNKLFTRIFLAITTIMLLALVIVSCEKDDEFMDAVNPEVENFITNISSAPGLEFKFEGKITDDNGIATVNIYYADWFIDKVIVFNEAPKEYTLNYKFLVPADAIAESSHTIKVGITDIGGNTITLDVLVTLDYDITKPEIVIVSPAPASPYSAGDSVDLNIQFSDDKALDSVMVFNAALDLDFKLKLGINETAYNYINAVEIPLTGVDGAITFEATAIDKTGNRESKIVTVIVGDSAEQEVYAVGGSMYWEWDPTRATKLWKDPDNENWFILEFYYWTGYGIKFVGQLGWEPSNWGIDPNNSAAIINSQDSEPIEFPDGDGYYRVKFNPFTLEYTYETMTVDIPVRDKMYLMGKGFVGYGLDWNPADAIEMEPDIWANPYVFNMHIEFSDSVDLKYLGQNDGWGPYDCGFEVGGEMQLPLNFAKGEVGDGTADVKFNGQAGWYWITFDYFLLRTTIQPYE